MHRMSQLKTAIQPQSWGQRRLSSMLKRLVRPLSAAAAFAVLSVTAHAQPPRVVNANIDYAASGYVTPAGMVAPAMYSGQPPMAGNPAMMGNPLMSSSVPSLSGGYGDIAQVAMSQSVHGCGNPSCDGSCDSAPMGMFGGGEFQYYDGSCDSMGGCGDAGCDSFGMGGGLFNGGCGHCGSIGGCGCGMMQGGVVGKFRSGQLDRSRFCVFCRGTGCGVCRSQCNPAAALAALGFLLPYQDAGLGAQRWYDLSVEGVFLSRSSSDMGVDVITQRGQGVNGVPVISASDLDNDDWESGVRASASLIFGAGGNIEATYLGGHEWDDSVTVLSPAVFAGAPPTLIGGADLFSFITDFGTNPAPDNNANPPTPGGFDDTDRSTSQTARSFADFHSGEINYRRRTVGPYQRFQGSWLVGLRYLRYDNGLGLDIVGLNNNGTGIPNQTLRFFNGSESVENSMLGGQIGGDFWWNVIPGINLGVAAKGLWLNNNIRGNSAYTANSIGPGATPGSFAQVRDDHDSTLAAEFEATMIYRLTHSWSVRTGYYLLAMEDIATPQFSGDFIRQSLQVGGTAPTRNFQFDTVTLQGLTAGVEYIW